MACQVGAIGGQVGQALFGRRVAFIGKGRRRARKV